MYAVYASDDAVELVPVDGEFLPEWGLPLTPEEKEALRLEEEAERAAHLEEITPHLSAMAALANRKDAVALIADTWRGFNPDSVARVIEQDARIRAAWAQEPRGDILNLWVLPRRDAEMEVALVVAGFHADKYAILDTPDGRWIWMGWDFLMYGM